MKKLAWLVLLGALFIGCGDSPVRPTPQPLPNPVPSNSLYGVSGLVTTSDGGAVEGAIVTVGDDFDVYLTGDRRGGAIHLLGASRRGLAAHLTKEGFETMTTRIELSEDLSLDVQLPPAGSNSARSRARAK